MDTISYLPSPADPTQMISVVTDHGWFTLKSGVAKAEEVAMNYLDKYDMANSKDVTKLLYESLDKELTKSLRQDCLKSHTFTSHWLHLIKIVRSMLIG